MVEQFSRSLLPLAFAYALSDDEAYAEKAAAILDGLATIYPTTIEGTLGLSRVATGL